MTLAERYKGISSSSLHKFDISPKLFKLYIDREIEEEEKPWLELGIKLHMYLLEPEEFKKNYIYLDFTVPSNSKQKEFCEEYAKNMHRAIEHGSQEEYAASIYSTVYSVAKKSLALVIEEATKLTKTFEEYITYLKEKDHYKDIINRSTLKFLNDAKFAINIHSRAKDLLSNNPVENTEIKSELRVLWEYPYITVDNLPIVVKSFLDRVVIDHTNKKIILVDLKTTSSIGEFEERFDSFNYQRQLALYWLGLSYYLSHNEQYQNILKEYKKSTYVVAVQTNSFNNQNPVECRVYPVSEATLDEGLLKFDKILQDIAWHFENNKWEHTRHYYENNGLEKTL